MPFPPTQTFDRAILLATLPDLSPPHFLDPAISWATKHTRTRLVIVLFSRHFNVHAVSRTDTWAAVQRILTFTYVQATRIAMDMNNVLMDIDVLLKGLNENIDPALGSTMDICFRVSGDPMAVPLPESFSTLRQSYLPAPDHNLQAPEEVSSEPADETPLPPLYPVTALGGTFDHLHAGHKILLSMGAWITQEKLIVGITDDALLQKKANLNVLEPLAVRTQRVHAFLTFFKPEITPDIVPITDVFGPTGWDPNIQALVVSKETLSGADAIAKHRKDKDLPPLQTFLIDVISATDASLDKDDTEWLKDHKLSSTFIRQWIVDQEKEK